MRQMNRVLFDAVGNITRSLVSRW